MQYVISQSTQTVINEILALNKQIRIGASCVYKPDRFDNCCKSVEIRTPGGRSGEVEDNFWNAIYKAINFNIFIRANITNYYNGFKSEADYRQEFRHYLTKLYNLNYKNIEIDCDNEPMKRWSKEQYGAYINWLYDENAKISRELNKKRFKIGAGCEEFTLAESRKDANYPGGMLEFIIRNCNYDVLVLHIQSSCTSIPAINYWKNWLNVKIFNQPWYKAKPITCNEANWNAVKSIDGFNMLLYGLKFAIELGCSDFDIVFVRLVDWSKYIWLSFYYNNANTSIVKIDTEHYQNNYSILCYLMDKLQITEEDDAMKLEKFYYWKKVTYDRDPNHYGDKFIQLAMNAEIESGSFDLEQAYEEYNVRYGGEQGHSMLIPREGETLLAVDGVFGERTSAVVECFQNYKQIGIDGIVGPITFDNLMDEHYKLFTKVQLEWSRLS